jgi:hypothetical protein
MYTNEKIIVRRCRYGNKWKEVNIRKVSRMVFREYVFISTTCNLCLFIYFYKWSPLKGCLYSTVYIADDDDDDIADQFHVD